MRKTNRLSLSRFDLLATAAAGGLWFALPRLGWWPFLLALSPWALRQIAGRKPFRPTPLDLPLGLFLLTTFVGAWAAYNPLAAQRKFWILIGALFLFRALTRQHKRNYTFLSGFLAAIGLLTAAYFWMTQDWFVAPADFALLNRLGRWWMGVRPYLGTRPIHPNRAGGLIALTTPFLIAMAITAWQEKKTAWLAVIISAGGFLSLSLLFTSSRAAWIILALALLTWPLWWLCARLARRLERSQTALFSLLGALSGLAGVGVAMAYTGSPVALANALPGAPSAASRVALARGTWDLIGDFPFTGSGLGTFPGLYSQYIEVIPQFKFGYSHNLYLDVMLEQGPAGFLALIAILAGSFWLVLQRLHQIEGDSPPEQLLLLAAFSGLLITVLHGLVDDPLYGAGGTPFLFLPAGVGVALSRPVWARLSKGRPHRVKRTIRTAGLVVAGLGLLLALSYRQTLQANWLANLGAIEMAQVELQGWPTGEWDDGGRVQLLNPAERRFQTALMADPDNRTAHYRLGLIEMLRRDYTAAIPHLQAALNSDPQHRGLRKTLGYSYVWVGEFEIASRLLAAIPESRQEMGVYRRWWAAQGRQDLAQKAADYLAYSESKPSSNQSNP